MESLQRTPLQSLLEHAKLRQYPKGQIIIHDGEVPSELFIVKSGIVKIHDIDDQGNEKILHLVKSQAVFPMIFFLGAREENRSFYTALTDTELHVIPMSIAEEKMLEQSELAIYLMRWFSREIHEILVRLSSLGKTTTYDKLIAALKFLCVHHTTKRAGDWQRVNFPVSHQLLADMVGVTRESTTMIMKELQEEKIVRTPKLTVLEINAKRLLGAT